MPDNDRDRAGKRGIDRLPFATYPVWRASNPRILSPWPTPSRTGPQGGLQSRPVYARSFPAGNFQIPAGRRVRPSRRDKRLSRAYGGEMRALDRSMPVRLVAERVDMHPARRRFARESLPNATGVAMGDGDLEAVGREP